jgi:hypothetical protein
VFELAGQMRDPWPNVKKADRLFRADGLWQGRNLEFTNKFVPLIVRLERRDGLFVDRLKDPPKSSQVSLGHRG